MKKSLVIVIVNFNTLDLLQQCLEHLQKVLNAFSFEIVLVDNASTDGSQEWIQALANEKNHCILSPRNLGFAGGCNLGIQQSTSEYILLLNTDAFPEPGSLQTLVKYLEQHPDVGIVGPQLVYPNGRWQRSTGRVPSPRSAFLDAIGLTSLAHTLAAIFWPLTGQWWRPREVEYVDGACMLIRRTVVDEIGSLNERFFFFVEDAEYCARARQYGWKVIHLPESRVIHLRGGSSSQKDYGQTVRLRACSEEVFVRTTQRKKAWQQVAFWRKVNFAWRMQLARIIGRKELYKRYRTAYQVYKESMSWTDTSPQNISHQKLD
jgi:hypothetical protein